MGSRGGRTGTLGKLGKLGRKGKVEVIASQVDGEKEYFYTDPSTFRRLWNF